MSEQNPHSVTVTLDEEGLRDTVLFTCAASTTDPCHIYPDDGRESWTAEEAAALGVSHERCWIADWFENDCYEYAGEDRIDEYGDMAMPHVARSGPITVAFSGDWIEWDWEENR